MILINFLSPFKQVQLAQVEAILHEPIDRVVNYPCQINSDLEILPQFIKLMSKFPLTDAELKSEPMAVVLPGQNYLAVLVIAHLHGRMGYFPPIFRTRFTTLGIFPAHEAVELLNPQAIEDAAK